MDVTGATEVPAGSAANPLAHNGSQILGGLAEKSEVEAPIGVACTPRHWKRVCASFPVSKLNIKGRRVPIIVHNRDAKSGLLKTETVAYAVGATSREAMNRADLIVTAINSLAPIVLITLNALLGIGASL